MAHQIKELIRALFQAAWADDEVSPAEVEALMRVLRQLEVPLDEIICLLDRNLVEKPRGLTVPLDQVFGERHLQMQALQFVMTVCFAEGVLQPEEVGYLEGLVTRVGVTAEELEILRRNATVRP